MTTAGKSGISIATVMPARFATRVDQMPD
jgi:hypothetical protein